MDAIEHMNGISHSIMREIERDMFGAIGIPRRGEQMDKFEAGEAIEKVRVDPVTFEHNGKTYEPSGEFMEPAVGEVFLHATEEKIAGKVNIAATPRRFSIGRIGRNRIILREVEKKERVLTEEDLVDVLHNDKEITVRCSACSCGANSAGYIVGGVHFLMDLYGNHSFFHENQPQYGVTNHAFASHTRETGNILWGDGVEGNITIKEETR